MTEWWWEMKYWRWEIKFRIFPDPDNSRNAVCKRGLLVPRPIGGEMYEEFRLPSAWKACTPSSGTNPCQKI
tara:strand:+ start:100 stop:312 length:213 start_codon:yes stop_codon:yes gene_type:complete